MITRSNAPAPQETPEAVARRRAIADAILGRTSAPQTLGEGFYALGGGIVSAVERSRADQAEQAGRAGADATRAKLVSLLGGGAMPANANAGALGAVNSVGQAAPTTSSFSGSQQEFIDLLMPTVLEVSAETGIDPRIIIAQAAQETGWGKSAPGNNFFGIKSHGKPGGQTFNTHEYVNGQRVNVADSFRTFESPEDSVRGYGEFIRTNPRYRDFMSAQGLDAQLEALGASGYATDPNYASSVGSIARGIALPQQPTQVASLDPSIGAPAPTMPGEGGAQPGMLPPQQVAQAGNLPMQPQAPQPRQAPGSDIPVEFLMEALASPWVDDATKAVASQLLQQQLAPPPGPIEVNGMLIDPTTMQPIYDARNPSVTNVNGTVIDNRTGQPIYQAPQQRPYEVIDGEVVFLDPQQGTASSAGTFGAPEPGWRGLTPEEKAAYGIPADSPAQINTATGEVKGLGGVNVTTNVGGQLSPGWEAIDKAFADTYLSWTGGGSADIQAQLANLDNALTLMESGRAETGNLASVLPREAQAWLNSDGLIARENVEETVQRSLRETLGAQFTEREGERLIQRAFNPLLPTSENIRRVNLLVGKIQEMAQAKDAMADYFRQNGTLKGYQGLTPTMSDLAAVEAQFGEDPGGGAARPSNGQSQSSPAILPPRAGEVVEGYRFKGGDPADPNSWEPVQ